MTKIIRVHFDGQALWPDGNHATAALHDRLAAGEVCEVDIDPQRSVASHNHQFAFVREAWRNLPEHLQTQPYAASPDHLRKHALIVTGYHHTDLIDTGAEKRAADLAQFIRRFDAREDQYSIITTDGPVVYRMTAQSQRIKAMGKKRFQESKQAILEWMAGLIGVEAEALAKAGRKGQA